MFCNASCRNLVSRCEVPRSSKGEYVAPRALGLTLFLFTGVAYSRFEGDYAGKSFLCLDPRFALAFRLLFDDD